MRRAILFPFIFFAAAALADDVADDPSIASDAFSAESDDEWYESRLVPATFAAGNWHVVEGRMGCVRGVHRTIVGHTSVNERQPDGPHDTVFIGDEVESVRVWYDPKVGSYGEMLRVFWELVEDPTYVLPGPLGPKQWQTAVYWHNEDQRLLAGKSLREMRQRYRPTAAESDEVDHDGDGGAANPVKTVVRRAGTFFQPAPRELQKAELRRRDEMKEPFARNMSDDGWMLRSRHAALLNGYLTGGCSARPWAEVEDEIKSLNLTFAQLESLGLEYMFPGVIVLPPFGAREEAEAQMKAAAQAAAKEKEKEKTAAEETGRDSEAEEGSRSGEGGGTQKEKRKAGMKRPRGKDDGSDWSVARDEL